jgi:glucose-1-phosphate cytidylyltransferase
MQVVILAGGLGSRLSEETDIKPKPMVEIGGFPIIWHIMKIYSHYGFNDFIICCGYKGYVIKDYFVKYVLQQSDIEIDLENNIVRNLNSKAEPWKIKLIETGLDTMTGARIKKILKYIEGDDFLLTYGDGLADVNIAETIEFHKKHGKLATVMAVQPLGRFGALKIVNGIVENFSEKPIDNESWINGGYFVLNKGIECYLNDTDDLIWEKSPLENLAKESELAPYLHEGFWHPMDTLKDKKILEDIWFSPKCFWKKWK